MEKETKIPKAIKIGFMLIIAGAFLYFLGNTIGKAIKNYETKKKDNIEVNEK